jgi:ribosomal protein L32
MAVPFRRTSKTAKRKRRTHFKLDLPALSKNADGEYTVPHRVNRITGTYKGRQVLKVEED